MARTVCHDPSMAVKFYVALPDKATGYETRRLLLKALKKALALHSGEVVVLGQ